MDAAGVDAWEATGYTHGIRLMSGCRVGGRSHTCRRLRPAHGRAWLGSPASGEGGLTMHYRTLGQTGLQVSEVGLGAMPFGGMVTQADGTQFGWTGTDDQESNHPRTPQ